MKKPALIAMSETGSAEMVHGVRFVTGRARSGWKVVWTDEENKKKQDIEIWDDGTVVANIHCSKIEIAN
jgi:hypothetical protein